MRSQIDTLKLVQVSSHTRYIFNLNSVLEKGRQKVGKQQTSPFVMHGVGVVPMSVSDGHSGDGYSGGDGRFYQTNALRQDQQYRHPGSNKLKFRARLLSRRSTR